VRRVPLATGTIVRSTSLGFHASPVCVAPIIAALRELLLQASERYHRKVLLLIEMTWAIRSLSGAVYLREYEAILHDLLQQHEARAICLYNQTTLLDAQLLLSLHMHQSVFGPDGPRMNPFFAPPEIYQRGDERAQFVYWLNSMQPGTAEMPAPAIGVSTPGAQPIYDLDTPPLFIAENSDQGQWKIRYASAERLYTGDYLADIPQQYADYAEEDWFWSRRYWLRDMYMKLLYGIAQIHRVQGQIAHSLSYADRALRIEPTSEAAHQEKLLALHAARRRDALDRQYRLYCQLLEQAQLDPPPADLAALYQRLRAELSS
jgi:hypothetical protein